VYWSNPHDQTLPDTGIQAPEELPFQEGSTLPSPRKEEDIKDFSGEVNMVHLMEINYNDDSMERVNMDDFREYLSDDDMQTTTATTEVIANFNHESSQPPPSVTVTIKMEDEDKDIEKERCRSRNQKRAAGTCWIPAILIPQEKATFLLHYTYTHLFTNMTQKLNGLMLCNSYVSFPCPPII